MSNISTIATYLARVSGQLQPMLEKVQGLSLIHISEPTRRS